MTKVEFNAVLDLHHKAVAAGRQHGSLCLLRGIVEETTRVESIPALARNAFLHAIDAAIEAARLEEASVIRELNGMVD